MEPMTSWGRPKGMTNHSRIGGLVTAGLLCTALAGCGTAVAATQPSTAPPAGSAALSGATVTAARQVGCASMRLATSVSVTRHLLVGEPVNGGSRTVTQKHGKLARALFGDLCAAVTHPDFPPVPIHCPADFGISYAGTFYGGSRVLAIFTYDVSGCQRVSLTAAGKTQGTLLVGRAAAAAPHLRADFAAVLNESVSRVYGSLGSQSIGPGKQGV
jgi:hypothetical protein